MSATVWVQELQEAELGPIAGLQGRWKRFVHPSPDSHDLIFAMGRLEPGEVAGWHEHPEVEVFFVLRGCGLARWKAGDHEESAELRPGVAFYKTANVPHQMVNTGDEPLVGIAAKV